jgi:hypothetical protein
MPEAGDFFGIDCPIVSYAVEQKNKFWQLIAGLKYEKCERGFKFSSLLCVILTQEESFKSCMVCIKCKYDPYLPFINIEECFGRYNMLTYV